MPSLHPRPLPPPSLPRPEDPAGRVEAIFTAPEAGAPMEQQGVVVVVPGVGIVGDRYALGSGTCSAPRWHDKDSPSSKRKSPTRSASNPTCRGETSSSGASASTD
ncbi:MAG: hypothetical protein R3B59_07110 [Dehalococcoidia bacterium]